MTATALKPQAMDSTTRLSSKVLIITRDLTAANGNVSYTGVGFQPTCLIVLSAISTSAIIASSWGIADSAKNISTVWHYTDGTFGTASNSLVLVAAGAGAYQQITAIVSYNADGFTLTWAKTGAPTGTLTISILCLR